MILFSGLVIGLMSSLHCVGMCGPIAMLVHGRGKGIEAVYYHLGRILTYTLLGVLVGYVGEGVSLAGYQKLLSVTMGLTVMALAIYPGFQSKVINPVWNKGILAPLRKVLQGLFKRKTLLGFVTSGLLNGLLPCGMVYMGLSISLATGDVWESAILMTGFGMGTLPLMMGVGFGSSWIGRHFSLQLRTIIPALSLVFGVLLIVRGMEWQIPYLSPVLSLVGGPEVITVCGGN